MPNWDLFFLLALINQLSAKISPKYPEFEWK